MKNTKEYILNVAFHLFLKNSFKEVTMKDIERATSMSRGALYHYFDSKEKLFFEIINSKFSSIVDSVYNKLNKDSLYEFYHQYINYFIGGLFNKSEEGNSYSWNYYSLIIDSIKLFPELQVNLIEHQKSELNLWKNIIKNSKYSGEINSKMNDEQIAKIFIYSSDGIGIRSIFMKENSENTKNNLLNLWNEFYKDLRN